MHNSIAQKRLMQVIGLSCIIAMMCMQLFTLCGEAAIVVTNYIYGDVDNDGYVTIVDATMIQRGLSGLTELSGYTREAADYDHEGEITIFDVSCIQKELADLPLPENYGGSFTDELNLLGVISDYNSGKAMTDEPVTFTAYAISGGSRLIYEFIIDGEVLQVGEKATLTHTFTESKSYEIIVNVYDISGRYVTSHFSYQVLQPYSLDNPVINSSYYIPDQPSLLKVNAIGGTQPIHYTFRINLTGGEGKVYNELYDYKLMTDSDTGIQYLLQDREDKNTSQIPRQYLNRDTVYNIIIHAIDSEGHQSEAVVMPYDTHIQYR